MSVKRMVCLQVSPQAKICDTVFSAERLTLLWCDRRIGSNDLQLNFVPTFKNAGPTNVAQQLQELSQIATAEGKSWRMSWRMPMNS